MKRYIFNFLLATIAISLFGEVSIPRNASEDVDNVMSQNYWDIWNDNVQKKIDADIEANRKADATFKIGEIKDGSEVVVEQISHDFKFGAQIFNFDQLGNEVLNTKYKVLYGTLFNQATIAFYWTRFETEPNCPRFKNEYRDSAEYWNKCESPKYELYWRRPAPEKIIEYCKNVGISIHGHPLIWDSRWWHMPTWLIDSCLTDAKEREIMKEYMKEFPKRSDSTKNINEIYTDKYKNVSMKELSQKLPVFTKNMKKAFEKHIVRIADYYKGTIESWDVVNESADAYSRGKFHEEGELMKSRDDLIMPADFTYDAFKLAEKKFPKNVKLNINDYIMTDAYRKQIDELISRGCKIDVVGAQMHFMSTKATRVIASGYKGERVTPDGVYKIMKRLDVGKPIHLSEVTITALDTTDKGKMMQAIITRNMYRLWFSIKPIMGITWWNVVDDCGAPGEPSISGLFTRAMNPKPAFYALDELINKEWKTNLVLKPDDNGEIKFRGFKGKYRLSWCGKDGKEHFKFIEVK